MMDNALQKIVEKYTHILYQCYSRLENYLRYCLRCIGKYMNPSLNDFIVFHKEEYNDLPLSYTVGVIYNLEKSENRCFYYSFTYEFSYELGVLVMFHETYDDYVRIFGV